ncbi:MAG: methyltransferase domain-containing protein [Hyphomicrobiales bacterium]|nr:methyltransferase domain-containing protein [Hyphomicrobiales bacterium]MBV8823440.1 methyltransferase domain-containing protein [Hyphomicrobiales bacterium]MBV9429584.1 methyltransferase domain-containing protein [Bradyrhizobiaceae bacterium]
MESDPHGIRAFELASWQRVAADYGDTFAAATRGFIDPLLDAARVNADTRVLDVCCGPGLVAGAAAARGARASGVDFSSAMLAIARAALPRVEFSQGDAEALPYAEDSFDAVVANFGVHHVPHPAAALAEMHRLLAPGGRAAFTVWPRPDTNVPWRLLFDAIRAHGALDAAKTPPPSGSINSEENCAAALAEAGFRDADARLVERAWRMKSVHDLLAAFRNGTARTAALIEAQDADALPAIAAHMAAQAERFRHGDELHIPIAAILASAVRP